MTWQTTRLNDPVFLRHPVDLFIISVSPRHRQAGYRPTPPTMCSCLVISHAYSAACFTSIALSHGRRDACMYRLPSTRSRLLQAQKSGKTDASHAAMTWSGIVVSNCIKHSHGIHFFTVRSAASFQPLSPDDAEEPPYVCSRGVWKGRDPAIRVMLTTLPVFDLLPTSPPTSEPILVAVFGL